jgi:hypothetical protein
LESVFDGVRVKIESEFVVFVCVNVIAGIEGGKAEQEENNTIEIKKDNFDLPMNTPFLRPTVRG